MKPRLLIGAVAAYFAFFGGVVALIGLIRHHGSRGPAQPIAFSHALHAGRLELECLFCHAGTDQGPSAGVPPVQLCMQCHENVAIDRPEVQKVRAHWERKDPIEWVRIHRVPDHVYFTHKRHVKAGLACTECHGEVTAAERMRQVRSLKMGWCVHCHRAHGAPTDCWTCHK